MKNLFWKETKFNGYILAAVFAFAVLLCEIMTVIAFSVPIRFIAIICDIFIVCGIFAMLCLIPDGIPKKIVMTAVFALLFACALVDTVYVQFYGNYAPVRSLLVAGKYVKGELGVRLNAVSIIAIVLAGLVLIFAVLLPLRKKKAAPAGPERRKDGIRKIAAVLTFVFACSLYGGLSVGLNNKAYASDAEYIAGDSFTYQTIYNSADYVAQFGYWSYRARELLNPTKVIDRAGADEYFGEAEKQVKRINPMTRKYEGYNIINILSETLDTRIIDPFITPKLYELVYGAGGSGGQADVFEDYYVPTFFDGSTVNSEFMSINGIYPVSRTMWSNNLGDMYGGNSFDTYSLAAQLKKAGYDTYYFHDNEGEFYLRDKLIPNYGFEHCYFYEEMSGLPQYADDPAYKWPFDSNLAQFVDKYVFSEANAAAYSADKNFYIDIMTFSMHTGRNELYKDRMDLVRDYVGKKIPEVVISYLAKCMEYDELIGKLIKLLETKGVLGKTLINIYPDHYAYGMKELYTDYLKIPYNDYTVKCQQLISLDGARYGRAEGVTYSKAQSNGTDYVTGCTVDLAPTFLNMLIGDAADYTRFFGNDIFDGSYVVFSDLSVYDGKGYMRVNGKTSGHADADKLRGLQSKAYKQFTVSQAILTYDYFKEPLN